jgi:hypothetical protein
MVLFINSSRSLANAAKKKQVAKKTNTANQPIVKKKRKQQMLYRLKVPVQTKAIAQVIV